MNFGEVKRQALVLMREWTIDGSLIPAEENADYIKSVEDLANIALMDIARQKKIPARTVLDDPTAEVYGDLLLYSLPADCLEYNKMAYLESGRVFESPEWLYRWIDDVTIGVNKDAPGDFIMHYYRLPALFAPDNDDMRKNDNVELDIAPETHYLVPFFVAAQLLSDEDRGLAQVKLNEYHARLAGLFTPGVPQVGQVQNVLGW